MPERLAAARAKRSKRDLGAVPRRVGRDERRAPEPARCREQRRAAEVLAAEPERAHRARPPEPPPQGKPGRGVVAAAPVEPAPGECGADLRRLRVTAHLDRRQLRLRRVAGDVDRAQRRRIDAWLDPAGAPGKRMPAPGDGDGLRRMDDLQPDGRALRDPEDVARIIAVAVLRPRVDRARRRALLDDWRLAEIVAEALRVAG